MEAPKEIWIKPLLHRKKMYFSISDFNAPEYAQPGDTKYHHDSKYQKAVEALKDVYGDVDCNSVDRAKGRAFIALKQLGEVE